MIDNCSGVAHRWLRSRSSGANSIGSGLLAPLMISLFNLGFCPQIFESRPLPPDSACHDDSPLVYVLVRIATFLIKYDELSMDHRSLFSLRAPAPGIQTTEIVGR